jgi:hypothetical protein
MAANGHLMLSWPHAGHGFFTLVCPLFRFKYSLRRMGHTVYSPYEMILPGLVGPGFRLKAGWDDFSGNYLLSEDRAGDEFLRRFSDPHAARL